MRGSERRFQVGGEVVVRLIVEEVLRKDLKVSLGMVRGTSNEKTRAVPVQTGTRSKV